MVTMLQKGVFLFCILFCLISLSAQEDLENEENQEQEKQIKKDPTELNDLLKELLQQDQKPTPVKKEEKPVVLPSIELKGKVIALEDETERPNLAIFQIGKMIYFVKPEDEIHLVIEKKNITLKIKEISYERVEISVSDRKETLVLR